MERMGRECETWSYEATIANIVANIIANIITNIIANNIGCPQALNLTLDWRISPTVS